MSIGNSLLGVMLFCTFGIVYADNLSSEHRVNRQYSTQRPQNSSENPKVTDDRGGRDSTIYSTQQHRNTRQQQQDKQDNQSMDAEVSVKWSYQQNRQDSQ